MNILKKLFKKDPKFQSTNQLEELLKLAADNEAYRPDFYRQIFHFKLFVIGKMKEEGSVQLLNNSIDGVDYSYAYTSIAALEYIAAKRNGELPYIEIETFPFFQMLESSKLGLILNADMDFGRIFTPNEIKEILNDDIGSMKERTLHKGSRVKIGVPSQVPEHIVEALKKFVNKNERAVKDIYFALKIEGEESAYLAAIELHDDSKMDIIVKDISIILDEIGSELPVDMAKADDFYRETYKAGGMISCREFK
jgi:hypothetical protein